MLLLQYSGGQRLLGVIGKYLDRRLNNDWASIHLCGDEMYGTAVYLYPFLQRSPVSMETRKGGKQRRVDIYQFPIITVYEIIPQDAHEPRKRDQIRLVRVDFLRQRGIECIAIGVRQLIQHDGCNAVPFCNFQPWRVRPIADNGRCPPGSFASIRASILLPRTEIRMTSDFISAEARARVLCRSLNYRLRFIPGACSYRTDLPDGFPCRLQ